MSAVLSPSRISESEETIRCGEQSLHRIRVRPAAPWAHLALLHGYGEHSGRHRHVLRWLAERGVEGHALDFRGQGRSSGRRGFVRDWHDYREDVEALLRCEGLRAEDRGDTPLFLLGHSHGGLVLADALEHGLSEMAGCILCAPYLRTRFQVPAYKTWLARVVDPLLPWLPIPTGLKGDWMSSDDEMRSESGHDPYILPIATPRWYLGCVRAQEETLRHAGDLRQPLLVLMGEDDPVADPAAARELYEAAGSRDKTYRSYPGLLHELLRERERERIFQEILDWMRARA
ncbi:MAG: lysophospholipase [Armatimonadota bacterium]